LVVEQGRRIAGRGVVVAVLAATLVGTLAPAVRGARADQAGPAAVRAAATPVDFDVDGDVYALAFYGHILFIGGTFASVEGVPRSNLAAINLTTRQVLPDFEPQVTADSGNAVVRALAVSGGDVYLGGEFDAVNGDPRHNAADVGRWFGDTGDWDPELTDGPTGGGVHALAVQADRDGERYVFVGGAFGGALGEPRTGLVETHDDVGTFLTPWNPVLGGAAGDSPVVTSLAVDPLRRAVYAGGNFTTVGGQARPHLVGFDPASGGAPLPWNPGAESVVHSLLLDYGNERIYGAGDFLALGGVFRPRAGAVRTVGSGTATAWRGTPDAYACPPGRASLAMGPDRTEVFIGCGSGGANPLRAFRAGSGTMIRSYPVDSSTGGNVEALIASPVTGELVAGGPFGVRVFPPEEPPRLAAMTIGNVLVEEGDAGTRLARVTVSISKPVGYATGAVFRTFRVGIVGPQPGSDYAAKEGVVTIPAGETSAVVTIKVYGNFVVEPDEQFGVLIRDHQAARVSRSSGRVTIRNDDRDPQRRISIGNAFLSEGDAGTRLARFTVSLSRPSVVPVSVVYATVPRTATPGQDYTPRWDTATIRPGALSATVSVPLHGDTIIEPTESYAVRLVQPHGAVLGRAMGAGQIDDDDRP
jgi:hypothetical protein